MRRYDYAGHGLTALLGYQWFPGRLMLPSLEQFGQIMYTKWATISRNFRWFDVAVTAMSLKIIKLRYFY